jgi:FMN phosphatase YigB (HAD superfamily)
MKVIVFDIDNTLGDFTQFGIIWDIVCNYYKLNYNQKTLSQLDFNHLLDMYPECLRPNIINILLFLREKKQHKFCHKIMIYTNNNGSKEWCYYIIKYLEYRVNYKLFDNVITAFKLNGKHNELCRTTHVKCYTDLVKCSKISKNTEICFIDDVYHHDMNNSKVYYIHLKPYYYNMNFDTMISRIINSVLHKKDLNNNHFKQFVTQEISDYKYHYTEKDLLEYEVDKIIGKQIIVHLEEFFHKSLYHKSMRHSNKQHNSSTRKIHKKQDHTTDNDK